MPLQTLKTRLSQHTARLPGPLRAIGIVTLFSLGVIALNHIQTSWLLANLFDRLERTTLDFRYSLKIRRQESQPPVEGIVIVDIDARSIDKLGRYSRWPRSYHAEVVEYLTSGGVKAIGFDILFADEEDSTHDHRLAEAVARAGNVYTALFLLPADTLNFMYPMTENPYTRLNPASTLSIPRKARQTISAAERIEGPFDAIAREAAGLVSVNTWPDDDGVNRALPLIRSFLKEAYPAMSLRLAMHAFGVSRDVVDVAPGQWIALDAQRRIPVDRQGRMRLWYYGRGGPRTQTFRYVSYYDVYTRQIPAEFFTGKIALIGSSLPGMGDLIAVPFNHAFPGVELHATALRNILDGVFLNTPSSHVTGGIVSGLSILVCIMGLRLRPLRGALLTLTLMMVYFGVTVWFFLDHRVWVEVIRPEGAMMLAYIVPLSYRYFTEERQRRQIKHAFQQYVSPVVIEEILDDPGKLKLGGEKRVVTILFSDLAGFTDISEQLAPEEVCEFLNEYLTEMTDIILRHDGMIDKYEGDLIMALFGAPVYREDHAGRACLAALEMQARLTELRTRWIQEGKPAIYARTGINTGEVVVGNMGSKTRMDYTVIGDPANLASRLEGANKQYGTSIMISEMTYEQAREHVIARELDRIRVKGKQHPVTVYEAVSPRSEELPPECRRMIEQYNLGLAAYRKQRWDEAEEYFRAALQIDPHDGPALVYRQRCEAYRMTPPPPDWDGVFQMQTK